MDKIEALYCFRSTGSVEYQSPSAFPFRPEESTQTPCCTAVHTLPMHLNSPNGLNFDDAKRNNQVSPVAPDATTILAPSARMVSAPTGGGALNKEVAPCTLTRIWGRASKVVTCC